MPTRWARMVIRLWGKIIRAIRKRGTIMQGWKMWKWKSENRDAWVENAEVEIAGKEKLWKTNILIIYCWMYWTNKRTLLLYKGGLSRVKFLDAARLQDCNWSRLPRLTIPPHFYVLCSNHWESARHPPRYSLVALATVSVITVTDLWCEAENTVVVSRLFDVTCGKSASELAN